MSTVILQSLRNVWLCSLSRNLQQPVLFIAMPFLARDLSLPVVLMTRDFTFCSNTDILNGAFNFSVMFPVACSAILTGRATVERAKKGNVVE
jgi:hypothetical protein